MSRALLVRGRAARLINALVAKSWEERVSTYTVGVGERGGGEAPFHPNGGGGDGGGGVALAAPRRPHPPESMGDLRGEGEPEGPQHGRRPRRARAFDPPTSLAGLRHGPARAEKAFVPSFSSRGRTAERARQRVVERPLRPRKPASTERAAHTAREDGGGTRGRRARAAETAETLRPRAKQGRRAGLTPSPPHEPPPFSFCFRRPALSPRDSCPHQIQRHPSPVDRRHRRHHHRARRQDQPQAPQRLRGRGSRELRQQGRARAQELPEGAQEVSSEGSEARERGGRGGGQVVGGRGRGAEEGVVAASRRRRERRRAGAARC